MSNLSWFVIDMLFAGLNVGIAMRCRNSWFSVFPWVLVFLWLALATTQFDRGLGMGG